MLLKERSFPSRIADLGFSIKLPEDWISHELPAEEPDFSNPATMFPLAIVTAPHSAMVFAFAARPAYEDGTLTDWASYLLAQNGLTPRAVFDMSVGQWPAVSGEALQESEMGPMLSRFVFFEDGDRLINISLSASELTESTLRGAWMEAIGSFTLESPRGSRFAK